MITLIYSHKHISISTKIKRMKKIAFAYLLVNILIIVVKNDTDPVF